MWAAVPPARLARSWPVAVARRRAAAAALRGRPGEIEGRVEHGGELGRQLGFPTANIGLGDYLEPMPGIYAVKAGIDMGTATHWLDGAGYLGRRATVGGTRLQLEVHLLDFDGDIYDYELQLDFLARLRGERRFDSVEALVEQMGRDVMETRRVGV